MQPVKILVDSDLIEEYFLNRSNEIYSYAARLQEIISRFPEVEVCITRRCVNKIFDPENNIDIASSVFGKFTICLISDKIRQEVRYSELKIEPALEIACALKEDVAAIITQEPAKYGESSFPTTIWSVDHLSGVLNAKAAFANREYEIRKRLSWLTCIEPAPTKEMIRNTAPVILEALKVLEAAGTNGLTEEELGSQLTPKRSAKTTRSIIWDLSHFLMAHTNVIGKVVINRDLLGSRTENISSYLSMVLQDNILVQEILKEIKLNQSQSITESGFEEIIKKIYPHTKFLKPKTLRDYRCRIASWLTSARIIEQRNMHKFVEFIIPVNDKSLKFDAQNSAREQLDMFEYQLTL